jgi:hypothetical protein
MYETHEIKFCRVAGRCGTLSSGGLSFGAMKETRNEDEVATEMPIPYAITSGGRAALVVGYVLLFGLTGLAVFHLAHPQTTPWVVLIAAWIWVLTFVACVWGAADEDGGYGPNQFLINRLGTFAGRQFVQIQRHPGETPNVGFGYMMGGRRFDYFRLPLRGIESVEWSSGQATALAGRDMEDWNVFVWYDTGLVIRRFPRLVRTRGRWVYCVGDSGPKEKRAEFGRRFVDFLRDAGADLVETEEGRKHVRRDLAEAERL